ncbi:DUF1540 domain-containing protein [Bacillus coahuilensis]|uniref:DUF1540 domain-containing protein n=1 Tax=Bacillus coahuilensis TaxID=408580 RepID=UPI00018508D2|nr:DUF1540 domain-containing protein [Bacillus coahuilensis]
MAKDVRCEVNNCLYWESGNQCGAERIIVKALNGKKAEHSKETDCETFEAV